MPRKPRIHVPGAFYHVTLRGNHAAAIFRVDRDRDVLDGIVAESLERHGARLHAFCWMTNHLHFLVQIANDPLSRIMHRIAGAYARAYQWRLETCGHLFDKRYRCQLVDADSYLLEVVRYIHLNPVRAGLARDPGAYPWSSHRVYLGLRSAPWVTTDFALRMLNVDLARARAAYRAFVSAGQASIPDVMMPRANDTDSRIVGDDRFLSRISSIPSTPRVQISVEALADLCSRRMGVSALDVRARSRARDVSRTRALVAHLATTYAGATVKAVADYFGRDESSVRRSMERLRREAGGMKSLEQVAASIMPDCRPGTDQ